MGRFEGSSVVGFFSLLLSCPGIIQDVRGEKWGQSGGPVGVALTCMDNKSDFHEKFPQTFTITKMDTIVVFKYNL